MSKIASIFQGFFRVLIILITPNTYRFFFLGQMRVAFYLSNGSVIKMNVKNVECTPGKSYKYDGAQLEMTIKPSEIIAIKEIDWF